MLVGIDVLQPYPQFGERSRGLFGFPLVEQEPETTRHGGLVMFQRISPNDYDLPATPQICLDPSGV